MTKEKKDTTTGVGVRSFMTAIVVLWVMMVLTYMLTFMIPGGGIPFWKWILSPVLVLFGEDNSSLIGIIVLLIVLGGTFNMLEKFGLLRLLLDSITKKFGKNKKIMLAVIPLFFMLLGSVAGTYEECVALVPVVVALAVRFGWDAFTGLGMSILAVGCGFASGICNPFTIGVAQEIAGLPVFSGIGFRILSFALIYGLLISFLFLHVKKIDKDTEGRKELPKQEGIKIKKYYYLDSKLKKVVRTFVSGALCVLPGVLLILMANSIRYTLNEGNILEYMLQSAISLAEMLPGWSVILFVYGLVLFMNFFIPSGSAKAFLLIPLIVPMAEVFGISAQLCVLAFAFGDGFSNVFYPTNPVLLISLGLADVSYGEWVKWSVKFQLVNLFLTSLLLLLGLSVGYC